MTDSNGNERFLFQIPANFAVGISSKNEVEAWLEIRTWLDKHRMFMLKPEEENPEKQRTPLHDRSMLKIVLAEGTLPNQQKEVYLEIDCHKVEIIGRSVPD